MGGYYHVYNRGVDKRIVFDKKRNFERFIESLDLFNDVNNIYGIISKKEDILNIPIYLREKQVEILSYCLLPNHYHLLIKELVEGGMPAFMKKLSGGYTKYYNISNDRSGSLFQGRYKKKLITSNEYLYYVTAYINGNAEIHEIESMKKWPWSSANIFFNNKKSSIVNRKSLMKNNRDLLKYIEEGVKNSKYLKTKCDKYKLE